LHFVEFRPNPAQQRFSRGMVAAIRQGLPETRQARSWRRLGQPTLLRDIQWDGGHLTAACTGDGIRRTARRTT
jgi:hypothetical protein